MARDRDKDNDGGTKLGCWQEANGGGKAELDTALQTATTVALASETVAVDKSGVGSAFVSGRQTWNLPALWRRCEVPDLMSLAAAQDGWDNDAEKSMGRQQRKETMAPRTVMASTVTDGAVCRSTSEHPGQLSKW